MLAPERKRWPKNNWITLEMVVGDSEIDYPDAHFDAVGLWGS